MTIEPAPRRSPASLLGSEVVGAGVAGRLQDAEEPSRQGADKANNVAGDRLKLGVGLRSSCRSVTCLDLSGTGTRNIDGGSITHETMPHLEVLLLRENGMRDLTGIFPKKSIGTVAQQYPPPLLWVVDFSGNEIADLTPLAEQKTLCLGYLSVENNCLPAAQFDVLKDLPVVDIRLTGNPLLFQKSHVLETQGGIRMKALEPKPARPISARVVQGDSKTTRAKHHASFGALKRAQSAKRVQNTWCGVDEIPNELSSHTFQDIDSTGTREDAKVSGVGYASLSRQTKKPPAANPPRSCSVEEAAIACRLALVVGNIVKYPSYLAAVRAAHWGSSQQVAAVPSTLCGVISDKELDDFVARKMKAVDSRHSRGHAYLSQLAKLSAAAGRGTTKSSKRGGCTAEDTGMVKYLVRFFTDVFRLTRSTGAQARALFTQRVSPLALQYPFSASRDNVFEPTAPPEPSTKRLQTSTRLVLSSSPLASGGSQLPAGAPLFLDWWLRHPTEAVKLLVLLRVVTACDPFPCGFLEEVVQGIVQSRARATGTCTTGDNPRSAWGALLGHAFASLPVWNHSILQQILEEANEKWQLAGELSLRDEDVSTAGVERRWLAEGAGGSEGGVAVDWDAGARDAFCCYQRLFVDDLYLVKAGLFVSRSGHRLPAGFEATAKRGLDRWHVARERVKKAMRVEREASWQSVTKHVFAHELLWRNERRYLETGSLREPYLLPRLSFELLGEPTSHELDTSPQLSARQSPVVINGQTQNKALQTNPHFNSPGPVLAVPTELPAADIPPIASPESPETVQNAANVQIDETGGTCPSQSEANAPTPEIGQLVDIESWNDGGGGFVADVQRGEGRVLLQIAPFGRMPRPAGHVVDPRENGFFQEAKPRDALGRLLRLSAGDQTAFKRIAGLSHSLLSEQSGGDGDVAQPQDDEQADFLRHLASFSHPKRITLPIEMCRWVPDATEPGAMVVVGSTRAALGRKFRDGSRSVLPESDPALPGLRRVAASMKKEAVPQKSAPTPPPPGHWCIQSPAAPRAGENVRVVPTKRGSRLVTLPIISLDEASGFAAVAVPLARPTAAIQPFLWRVEGGELLARFPLAQLRWIPTGRGSEWVFVTAKTEQSKTGWKKSNQPLPKELQSAAGQQRQGGEYAAPDVLPQPRDSAVFAAPSPEVSPRGDSVDHGPPESVYGSVPNKPSASPTDGVPSLAPASVKPRGPKQKAGPPMPDSVRSPTDGASSRALDAKFQHDATCFSDASPSTQQHQQHPFVEESLHRMATKRQQLDLKAVHRKAAEYSDAPPGRPTTPLDCSVSLRNARTTYASGATQQFMPRSIRSHIGDSLVESAKRDHHRKHLIRRQGSPITPTEESHARPNDTISSSKKHQTDSEHHDDGSQSGPREEDVPSTNSPDARGPATEETDGNPHTQDVADDAQNDDKSREPARAVEADSGGVGAGGSLSARGVECSASAGCTQPSLFLRHRTDDQLVPVATQGVALPRRRPISAFSGPSASLNTTTNATLPSSKSRFGRMNLEHAPSANEILGGPPAAVMQQRKQPFYTSTW